MTLAKQLYSAARPSQWLATSVLLLLILQACGFSLRSGEQTIPGLDSLQLTAAANSPLSAVVARRLEEAGVLVALENGEASVAHRLVLEAEEIRRIAVTASSRARGAEYRVSMSVNMRLLRDGALLHGPEQLQVERRHNEDTANLAGSAAELQHLHEEMREALATQLLRRLRSLTAADFI